ARAAGATMIQQAVRRHDPEPISFQDRRVWPRAGSCRPLPRRLYRTDTFQALEGWLLDLSQGGVALLLSSTPPIGTLLFVEMETERDAPPLRLWAEIVRSAPADDGNWLIGCEFVNPLNAAELSATLD